MAAGLVVEEVEVNEGAQGSAGWGTRGIQGFFVNVWRQIAALWEQEKEKERKKREKGGGKEGGRRGKVRKRVRTLHKDILSRYRVLQQRVTNTARHQYVIISPICHYFTNM